VEVPTSPSVEDLKQLHLTEWIDDTQLPWDVYSCSLPWQGQGLKDDNFAFTTLSGHITGIALTHARLKEVPPAVFQCEALKRLFLNGNQIELLPREIGNLKSLTDLSVGHNPIASLPSSVTELSHLTTLDIADTSLPEMPPLLLEMDSLQKIFVLFAYAKYDTVIGELRQRGVEVEFKFPWHSQPAVAEVREAIMMYLENHPDYRDPWDLEARLDVFVGTFNQAMRELKAEGLLRESPDGNLSVNGGVNHA